MPHLLTRLLQLPDELGDVGLVGDGEYFLLVLIGLSGEPKVEGGWGRKAN